MLMYPQFDPVALSLGPVKFHWYGLMYVLSFMFFLYAGKWRIRKYGHPVLTEKMLDDILLSVVIGTVVGGRYFISQHFTLPIHLKYCKPGMVECHFMAV